MKRNRKRNLTLGAITLSAILGCYELKDLIKNEYALAFSDTKRTLSGEGFFTRVGSSYNPKKELSRIVVSTINIMNEQYYFDYKIEFLDPSCPNFKVYSKMLQNNNDEIK
jgi:hypothetical protein